MAYTVSSGTLNPTIHTCVFYHGIIVRRQQASLQMLMIDGMIDMKGIWPVSNV